MSIAPCPRLSIKPGSVFFTDATGGVHDLLTDKLLSPGEAALRLNRSRSWILQQVRASQLYPVLRTNSRDVQIFACALVDYRARQLVPQGT